MIRINIMDNSKILFLFIWIKRITFVQLENVIEKSALNNCIFFVILNIK